MMSESLTLNSSPTELGKLVATTAIVIIALMVIHIVCHGSDDNTIHYVVIVVAAVMAVCAYGITQKMPVAYWAALVISALLIVYGVFDICVMAKVITVSGYSSTWILGVLEIIDGAVAVAYIVGSKSSILE